MKFNKELDIPTNVTEELTTVEEAAKSAIDRVWPHTRLKIHGLEVGSDRLASWYNDSQTPILVTDDFRIKIRIYPLDAGMKPL